VTKKQIITILFTDIEHSTRLAQQLREDYPDLLRRYRSVVRDAILDHGGREIDVAGDGFFITFDNADNAVRTAHDIQRIFHSKSWAKKVGLKVRMGIHTGEALTTDTGYTGVQVHCASRICDAAHGGQILISFETKELLTPAVLHDSPVNSLGEFMFKDFFYPCQLFQLNVPGTDHDFPQPRIESNDKRIAVLPFENLSDDADNEHFCHGIAEELIFALGKIEGLRVISRSSAFALHGKNLPVQEVGKKLNVSSVLEGRVRTTNGQMKISVELVDSNTGLDIWSGQYDSPREQIFNMQDKITHDITEALECKLIPEQLHTIEERQTKNIEAYDFYLRGRRFYLQFSTRGTEHALLLFEKAIDEDATYALAYAGIADCYSYLYQHMARTIDNLDKADKASLKAISLDPYLGDVHASRGIVLSLQSRFEEAEKAFETAIESDPSLFHGWFHYGRMCFTHGKLDKAARLFQQANRVEPDDYQSILLAAQVYYDLGSKTLSHTLRQRGVKIARKWLELNPGDTRALYMAANALVFLDESAKSQALLKRALVLEPEDSMLLYNAGCIYALLGMETLALNCLERSYKEGLTLKGWYMYDGNLDTLRDHPRFVALLEKMADT